jgi:hypothetical protein
LNIEESVFFFFCTGTYTITGIFDGAFCNNTGITNVKAPFIHSIGSYAFSQCVNLEAFEITGTQAVTIGSIAFYGCSGLTAFNVKNIITIGINAFYSCKKLNLLQFSRVKTIKAGAFFNVAVWKP